MTLYFTFYKKPEYSGDNCFFKIENLNLEKENFNYEEIYPDVYELDSHIKKDKICIEVLDDFLGIDFLLSTIYSIQSEQTIKHTTIEIYYRSFKRNFYNMITQIERAAKF